MPIGGAVLTFPRQICRCSDKSNTPWGELARILDSENAERWGSSPLVCGKSAHFQTNPIHRRMSRRRLSIKKCLDLAASPLFLGKSSYFRDTTSPRKINRRCFSIEKCRAAGEFPLFRDKSAHFQTNPVPRRTNRFPFWIEKMPGAGSRFITGKAAPISDQEMPSGGAVLTFSRRVHACSHKSDTP